MTDKNEPGLGSLKISQDVIVAYVADAALSTEGVHDFSRNLGETLSKNLLGKESRFKGVKIDENDMSYTIDLFVIVEYGVKISEVAYNIQKNVKACLEDVMDIDLDDINIHVQGVYKPGGPQPEGGLDA